MNVKPKNFSSSIFPILFSSLTLIVYLIFYLKSLRLVEHFIIEALYRILCILLYIYIYIYLYIYINLCVCVTLNLEIYLLQVLKRCFQWYYISTFQISFVVFVVPNIMCIYIFIYIYKSLCLCDPESWNIFVAGVETLFSMILYITFQISFVVFVVPNIIMCIYIYIYYIYI